MERLVAESFPRENPVNKIRAKEDWVPVGIDVPNLDALMKMAGVSLELIPQETEIHTLENALRKIGLAIEILQEEDSAQEQVYWRMVDNLEDGIKPVAYFELGPDNLVLLCPTKSEREKNVVDKFEIDLERGSVWIEYSDSDGYRSVLQIKRKFTNQTIQI